MTLNDWKLVQALLTGQTSAYVSLLDNGADLNRITTYVAVQVANHEEPKPVKPPVKDWDSSDCYDDYASWDSSDCY